jgi:uncharacterized protein
MDRSVGRRRRMRTMADIMLWRRLDCPGHDFARLDADDHGWKLSGTAIFADEQLCRLRYVVTCDSAWRTQSAQITGEIGGQEVDRRVSVDAERRWWLDGVECRACAGCDDIDLAFTPATNLLAVRRLALAQGAEAAVTAAWLAFPSLQLQPLPQRYRREAQSRYRYEAHDGTFVRTLDVDRAGFVTVYPGFWEAERPN